MWMFHLDFGGTSVRDSFNLEVERDLYRFGVLRPRNLSLSKLVATISFWGNGLAYFIQAGRGYQEWFTCTVYFVLSNSLFYILFFIKWSLWTMIAVCVAEDCNMFSVAYDFPFRILIVILVYSWEQWILVIKTVNMMQMLAPLYVLSRKGKMERGFSLNNHFSWIDLNWLVYWLNPQQMEKRAGHNRRR